MSSQALFKKITALQIPKYRQKYGQFAVEGRKGVSELIHSNYKVHNILATAEYLSKNDVDFPVELINAADMKRVSSFSTPPGIIAVADMHRFETSDLDLTLPLTLCLDGISDPGNLGTMIRTADWFGINQVVLSLNCTDFYNPKCISATMGSFTRCVFVYENLAEFLPGKKSAGCFLDGTDVADFVPERPFFLVVGSESHGISIDVQACLANQITIPGYGVAESLNAAIAAGIVMEHLSRKLKLGS